LNLIGRYIYVASVAEMGVEASERSEASVRVRIHRKLSPDIERQYLSFSWWLIHQSWRTCVDKVQEAVREVLGDISLKKKCQYQDVCDLFDQIRTKVEVGSDTSPSLNQQLRNILIPDHDDQVLYVLRESGNDVDHIDPTLRELLDETRDFFDK
jgi:peroxin-3